MNLRIESELGRLRTVLVHRPGAEIDRMVPSLMERLLFDDILDGEQARTEHGQFCTVLERSGVRVVRAGEALAEALADEAARRWVLAELGRQFAVGAELRDELAALTAAALAAALIEGVRDPEQRSGPGHWGFFRLDPIPNYFFQRDCQVVLGERVMISAMATDARDREPLLARTLFSFHPELAGSELFDIGVPPHAAPEHNPAYPYPTVEGGDVLIAGRGVILVGVSERTNRWGVEYLAEHLRSEDTGFRYLIVVEMPRRRSFMHLDTVFTFIDHDSCLGYLPVVEPGSPDSAHVYQVDLGSRELAFAVRPSLRRALAEHGLDIELVPCGGSADPLDQEREQWTDGANAFAIAPGVIALYRRNRRTLEELDRRGWRVVEEADLLAAGEAATGGGRTAVALSSNELSRARGGPRCMTMPLVREAL